MTHVFEVAAWVSRELDRMGLPYALIGGVALQVWGEPRVTRDVDVSVLAGFGDEPTIVARLLEVFPSRREDAFAFALANRVLLCQSPEGIGIDLGLAAFAYEESALARGTRVELLPGIVVPVVCAEDLVVMKVFAGRPQDWIDVRGILVRQGDRLDWAIVDSTLPELLDLLEEPERLVELHRLKSEVG